ncbi:riboflavin kinase [Buchnera aphidicola]|uniref:riboflavin kinase n=1 Tax=Buchnera aphidicola TaxID=9 RepID=UPI00165181D9|nr:riboflavin kinase [Buchnera aphidicola]
MSIHFKKSSLFLGKHFSISGIVQYGCQKGRQLGFPTANISIHPSFIIIRGVYAVKIIIGNKKKKILFGVANIGIKPTFFQKKLLLEVYIFNINSNLYGKKITIFLMKKIRNEKIFFSLKSLKKQIKTDIIETKNFFFKQTTL